VQPTKVGDHLNKCGGEAITWLLLNLKDMALPWSYHYSGFLHPGDESGYHPGGRRWHTFAKLIKD
jgi:hypothetical protein